MEHVQELRKAASTLEGLRADRPEGLEEADELFEALASLKDSYKIRFDLESFANTNTRDLDNANLEWALRDDPENNPRVKKTVKRLFNVLIAHLLRSIQLERSFEPALERLLQLMEFESSMGADPRGARALDFLDMVLHALFLGNFYGLGVAQHLLLNGSCANLLPQSLSNIVKNPDRAKKVNELMNPGDPLPMELYNERLVIFVSKLPTPDGPRTSRGRNALNIAKKELAVKTSAFLLDTSSPEPEPAEASSSSDSDEDSDESEDVAEDEALYATQYNKMWETIVDSLMYRADGNCLALILESMPRLGLPYLYNPLRVANFLYSSLNSDREDVVVNSLNCLLELILHHKLTDQVLLGAPGHGRAGSGSDAHEFDWFYSKLYDLIDFRYLSSRSSPVLILMAERALSSPMLPTRLVSSFIKRLLEAAAVAETHVCNCMLAISFRLLHKHHRNLLHMIHAPGPGVTGGPGADAEGNQASAGEIGGEADTFLHELYLLLHHFSPDTAKIAGVFFTDLRQRSNLTFDTRDFLQPAKLQKLLEKSQGTQQSPFRRTVQNSTSLAGQLFWATNDI